MITFIIQKITALILRAEWREMSICDSNGNVGSVTVLALKANPSSARGKSAGPLPGPRS